MTLFCIFIGLWLCIPFSLNHPAVKSFSPEIHDWFGDLPARQFGRYLDYALLLILGSVPWQVYFQRVLSSRSAFKAKMLSYVAAFGCIVMAIPSMIIGAVARVTVWEETDFKRPLDDSHTSLVLPMVLQYLTPPLVQFVGLGAVSAAVMSSSDLSLLSASLMFARNASEHEVVWVMRVSIIVVGAIATTMAFYVKSIYGLWYLSSDIVYVVLFPRLVCVVYFKRHCYTYGSLAAYVLGFLFLLARFNYPSFQTLNNIFKASNQPKTIAMLRKLRANHKRNKIFHRRIKISTKTNAMDYQLNLMVVT
ncbi:high-affinity choline transporter 1-like [Tetranychus urticae]|uniref:high-affinity choline transporter 1-like n=1 Tax=Tetranychus urticae TaxID=32264 RepID=UPI000D659DD8|nr:high-affinity choline transporter 1-like [Tetranychus urticae]